MTVLPIGYLFIQLKYSAKRVPERGRMIKAEKIEFLQRLEGRRGVLY
jgi:hypothetical protein